MRIAAILLALASSAGCVPVVDPTQSQALAAPQRLETQLALVQGAEANTQIVLSLSPLRGLVDGMIAQLADDSDADVSEELFLRQTEQDELSGVTSSLKHAEQLLIEQTALIAILSSQLDHAKNATGEGRVSLRAVNDALQHHSDNCRAEVPHLTSRAQHTQRDLELLNQLEARLQQITANGTTTQQMSLMLAQLHHSLRVMSLSPSAQSTHATSHALTELLQFAESSPNASDLDDGDDDGQEVVVLLDLAPSTPTPTDIERMAALLKKLRDELALVLSADQAEIARIDTACAAQESDLTREKGTLLESLNHFDQIIADRTNEIAAAASVQQELQQEVDRLSKTEAELQAVIADRMQVYLTLMKGRQAALLTLGEMNFVLSSLVESINSLQLPEFP